MRAPMEILLERESVLAQLCVLVQRAGRGAGQVVLLRGEAGVGKTAVIRHFIAGLDERVRVLRGSCDPLATPRPLGPLIDMLAQLPGPQAGGLAEICVGSHTCCGHWVAPPRPPPPRKRPCGCWKTVGRARSWPGRWSTWRSWPLQPCGQSTSRMPRRVIIVMTSGRVGSAEQRALSRAALRGSGR